MKHHCKRAIQDTVQTVLSKDMRHMRHTPPDREKHPKTAEFDFSDPSAPRLFGLQICFNRNCIISRIFFGSGVSHNVLKLRDCSILKSQTLTIPCRQH